MNQTLNLSLDLDPAVRSSAKALEILAKGREFRERYIDPSADEIDKRLLEDPHYHPEKIVAHGCEYGFFSLPVPGFLGGGDARIFETAVLVEELCAGCAGIANIFGAHYLGISPILMSLDMNLYDRFLYEIVRGEKQCRPVIFSAAVTEPMAGTDVEDGEFLPTARLTASAKRVEGGFVLNGSKVFISNGSVADYNVIICAIDKSRPVETWSAFVVPADSTGFKVGRVELKMGQRACHAAELVFEDCFVPACNQVGVEGRAMEATDLILAASRAPVGAIATGIARGAFEKTITFCRARRSGGGRLIDRQWVQMALADMASRIQLSRKAYLDAADLFDSFVIEPLLGSTKLLQPLLKAFTPLRRTSAGLKMTSRAALKRRASDFATSKIDQVMVGRSLGLSSLAKFSCSDNAIKVCLKAIEVLGHEGAEERCRVEKYLRDAKLTQIYEGTNQLNRYETFKKLLGS
ncbi:acyl-CoA dehydrogenase family protein [Thermodesulfobacteriota bacterium]